MDRAEKQRLIDQVPFWFHSIDCGEGVITPGFKPVNTLATELANLSLPDLHDKSVLDIGAWDGFFSFAAEELGARRVMALDHYVWSFDIPAEQGYYQQCRAEGRVPSPYHRMPGIWQPGTLPGKQGFDTIHKIKSSRVEQLVGDFMVMNPLEIGQFDIVLFLGVLYHLEDPFGGLKRLSMLTREMAVIETHALFVREREDLGLMEFFESNELEGDVSNWSIPNLTGLAKMCRAAGFREIRVTSPYPPSLPEGSTDNQLFRYRLTVQALK